MRQLSTRTKVAFALAGVVVLLAYLLILEFGLNAGRIHHGVRVAGFELGGMTVGEAEAALRERRSLLRAEDVCFGNPYFDTCVSPSELGWFPSAEETVATADAVGRSGGPLGALGERIAAWTGGVNVGWTSGPRAVMVSRLIREWNERLEPFGERIDSARLRYKIKRAIVTYPRREFRLPLEG